MTEWQDISTIDPYLSGPIRVGAYDGNLQWHVSIARRVVGRWESTLPVEPTHFQELPPPPLKSPMEQAQ